MTEPKILPIPEFESVGIGDIKFCLAHSKRRTSNMSPGIDPIHIHSYTEIFVNIDSDVSFLVENRLYPLSRGDVIISPPGASHVCIFNRDTVHDHACIWIDAERGSYLTKFIDEEGFSPLITFGDGAEKFLELVAELEASTVEDCSELSRAATLLNILSMLETASGTHQSEHHLPAAMQAILDDIHENCMQIKSVNDIIDRNFISGATLNRYFRKYIHLSPREYLESQKLSYATRLLLSGDTVTDCCMKAGFSDCSHFISLFKKKFGTTPFKYKQSARL